MCMYACLSVWIHECWCLWRPEESIGSPRDRVTGGCEPLDMGSWNQIQVLFKSSTLECQAISPIPGFVLIFLKTGSPLAKVDLELTYQVGGVNFHSSPALTACVGLGVTAAMPSHPASLVCNTFVLVSGNCLFVVRLILHILV